MNVSVVGVGDGVAAGVGCDDGMIVAVAVGNGPAADGAGVGVARLLADGVAQAAGYRRQGGCGRSGWSTRWARRWGWDTELGRRWSVCRRRRGRWRGAPRRRRRGGRRRIDRVRGCRRVVRVAADPKDRARRDDVVAGGVRWRVGIRPELAEVVRSLGGRGTDLNYRWVTWRLAGRAKVELHGCSDPETAARDVDGRTLQAGRLAQGDHGRHDGERLEDGVCGYAVTGGVAYVADLDLVRPHGGVRAR